MASNFACIGLDVSSEAELNALIVDVLPDAQLLGHAGGVEIRRWQDVSGARLVLGLCDGEVLDLVPSFDGAPGVRVADCRPLNADVVLAAVLDEDGEQTTAMAFELEQRRVLDQASGWRGQLSVAAFATDVEVFVDADEFSRSPRSLLDPSADPGPPPPHYVERGLSWPVRMGEDSFISYGAFGASEDSDAYARLNGIVLSAEPRRNGRTGTPFTVCRVRCLDFEVDVLLDTDRARVPAPGDILGGTVFLVADAEDLPFPARRVPPVRRIFRRRRGA